MTLIEITFVLVIIGLLTAIAIPLVRNMRENAYDGVVRSDFRRAWESIEIYFVTHLTYPASADAADFTPSKDVIFDTWDVQVFSGKPGMLLEAHHVNSAYQFRNAGYPGNTEIEKIPFGGETLSHRGAPDKRSLLAMGIPSESPHRSFNRVP